MLYSVASRTVLEHQTWNLKMSWFFKTVRTRKQSNLRKKTMNEINSIEHFKFKIYWFRFS